MSLGALALALLAGLLSVLSPCVLPLLPLVLGAAASQHRFGPVLLALGVALSFVAIGLFVATIGFSIGLDGSVFRLAAAAVMILVGLVLALPPLQARFSAASMVQTASRRIARRHRGQAVGVGRVFDQAGIIGQHGGRVTAGAAACQLPWVPPMV